MCAISGMYYCGSPLLQNLCHIYLIGKLKPTYITVLLTAILLLLLLLLLIIIIIIIIPRFIERSIQIMNKIL